MAIGIAEVTNFVNYQYVWPCIVFESSTRSRIAVSAGKKEFYHQILAAVMVHPKLKTVLPVAFEPITKRDGDNKNDCERNAAKRLLVYLADAF